VVVGVVGDHLAAGDALARARGQGDPSLGIAVLLDLAGAGVGGGAAIVLAGLDDARALFHVAPRGQGFGGGGWGGTEGYGGQGGYGVSQGYGQGGYGQSQGAYGQTQTGRRGPKGWQRSDDRIKDDISERLYNSTHIDSSEVTVEVSSGKVTLEGSVRDRNTKHEIENLIDQCPGVKDIENRIRVTRDEGQGQYGQYGQSGSSGYGSTGSGSSMSGSSTTSAGAGSTSSTQRSGRKEE